MYQNNTKARRRGKPFKQTNRRLSLQIYCEHYNVYARTLVSVCVAAQCCTIYIIHDIFRFSISIARHYSCGVTHWTVQSNEIGGTSIQRWHVIKYSTRAYALRQTVRIAHRRYKTQYIDICADVHTQVHTSSAFALKISSLMMHYVSDSVWTLARMFARSWGDYSMRIPG